MKEKIVVIEWDDASAGGGWQHKDDRRQDCRPYRCRTAGFLIDETEHSVLLCLNLSSNNKYSETMQIPKTQIRKRRVVARYG